MDVSVAAASTTACYLALIEAGKRWFYRAATTPSPARRHLRGHRLARRAARLSVAAKVPQGEQ
jgi:hypothetical protein